MSLSRHDRKRLKRLVRDLVFWRKGFVKALHAVNKSRYSERRIPLVREGVNANKKNIRYIDYLIEVASIMMKTDMPELEEVPRVTVKKHLPLRVRKPKKDNGASFSFAIG